MNNPISKVTGPCAILAGAGTGKTWTIVEKVKYLIKNKVYKPERIVCLTFSNEAVNTLRQRILPEVTGKNEPIIRTFHSYCAELLRKHGSLINVPEKFKIILPDDGKILLHRYFKIHPQWCTKYIDEISIAKDKGSSIEIQESKIKKTKEELNQLEEELLEVNHNLNTSIIKKNHTNEEDLKLKKGVIEEEVNQRKFINAWKSYEKIKQVKNGLDYSDLHEKALKLITEFPKVVEECDYLIIDEFQDTNKIQCDLIEKIALKKNLTIVGDLNQSIYRFRGAYKDNFSQIKSKFNIKESDMYKLDKSRRSTNKILSIAHKLIENNYVNKSDCFEVRNVSNDEGENGKVYELKNSREEVRKIIELIREELIKNTPFSEICVIFRTHGQSSALKKQLEYENIPFTTINKESLLSKPIIKRVRAYLTLITKYQEGSKWGDSAWWELIHYANLPNKDEREFSIELKKLASDPCVTKNIIENGMPSLSEATQKIIKSITAVILTLSKEKGKKSPELIKELYFLLGIANENREEQEQILLLDKFYSLSVEYSATDSSELSSFMYHLTTIDALGINIESPTIAKDGVRIMTNHATKGLEYTAVIIGSLVQKKFPMEKVTKNIIELEEKVDEDSQLAEERRLFYVGITRAKKRIYFTYSKEYGKRQFEPSQFLKEINYKKNESITFIEDSEEKYVEPAQKNVPDIETASEIEEKQINFSPSALQIFDECQKRYEFKYIYNMPDKTPGSWEAITLGTFVHYVLEQGVKNGLKTIKEFEDCAKLIHAEEFPETKLEEAMPLIKVFFERNKNKYSITSRTEQELQINIDNINFKGYADRIDIEDNGEITIIDYKTGKSDIKPRYRNWQLGIYALASKSLGKPKTLILDMLQKDHSLEFKIDNNGIAKEIHSARTQFSLEEVKQEIVETAKKIIQARKTGFNVCPVEKNCEFCNEWV